MDILKTKAQIHATNIWTRIKPRKRTVLGGAIILIIVGYFIVKGSNSTPVVTPKIGTVVSGDVINSIKVIWNTKITDQQTLTFGQEWTVQKVYVKEWQAVKKWDLLAELDKKTLSINMSQQGLSIQNARINYQKLLTAISEWDIVGSKNNLDTAQRKLQIVKNELEDMMLSNGDTLQTKATSVQSVLISTKSSINELKRILDDIDDMFSITSKTNTDEINRLLSAKMPSYKTMTESSYQIAASKFNILESTYNMIQSKTSTTVTEMEGLQDKNKDVLNALSTCISNGKNALDNSIISVDLTDSKLTTWKSTLNSANTSVTSRLSSLNSEGKSLRTTDNDIQNKKNEIANYESQVKMYQESYQDMLNGPSREDRQLQLNSIKQSQLSLAQLSQQGENYEIRAPFDGNVDVINIKLGDKITADIINEKSITVSNPNIYEIDMLIDQVDIVKVNKGQPVEIAFDSYPDYIITWAIWEIDPTPTTNAWVVSYTAKVVMTKGEKKIYDSMTVTVTIITEKKSNTLIVPSTAIQVESGSRIVQIMQGTEIIEKKVVVGIKDAINTEILSGLSLGDKILTQRYISPDQKIATKTGKFERPNDKGLGVWGGDPSANQGRGN